MATVPAPEESLRRSKPTSRELAFIIGVPAAWAILLLFHPLGGDSFYETIDGNVTAWITVHLGMGVFVPLFAGVVYLLLRGLQGTAATATRTWFSSTTSYPAQHAARARGRRTGPDPARV